MWHHSTGRNRCGLTTLARFANAAMWSRVAAISAAPRTHAASCRRSTPFARPCPGRREQLLRPSFGRAVAQDPCCPGDKARRAFRQLPPWRRQIRPRAPHSRQPVEDRFQADPANGQTRRCLEPQTQTFGIGNRALTIIAQALAASQASPAFWRAASETLPACAPCQGHRFPVPGHRPFRRNLSRRGSNRVPRRGHEVRAPPGKKSAVNAGKHIAKQSRDTQGDIQSRTLQFGDRE